MNTNPVHDGVATYYYATGGGSCGFSASPGDLMVTALSTPLYGNAEYCGAYLRVVGPKGEATVRVVDLCPGCADYGLDLDLSEQAFAQIANLSAGRAEITWQVVSPPISGPVAYHIKDGSNAWWLAVQMRNHRNPIAKLEFRDSSGNWYEAPRYAYNYFVIYWEEGPQPGPGPYTFRVTDWYGNQLVDSGIPLVPGGTFNGAAQFPAFP